MGMKRYFLRRASAMKFFSNLQVGNSLCKIFLKIKHGTWLDSRKHFLDFFFMAVLERFFLQLSAVQ